MEIQNDRNVPTVVCLNEKETVVIKETKSKAMQGKRGGVSGFWHMAAESSLTQVGGGGCGQGHEAKDGCRGLAGPHRGTAC